MGIVVREWLRDWAWGIVAGVSWWGVSEMRADVVRSVLRLGTPEAELVLYWRFSECRGEREWGEASFCRAPRKLLVSDGVDSWGSPCGSGCASGRGELSLATVDCAE